MSNVLLGLLSTLLATNQPVALSNYLAQQTGIAVRVPDPNDPLAQELRRLMEADDAAQAEIDTWILDAQKRSDEGEAAGTVSLRARMDQRFAPVRQGYEEFIKRHPRHAEARVAYGSFLNDIAEEEAARNQFEKAVEIDPKLPAAWNNLANIYGHIGPVDKAFECYGKALALKPLEPVYYQNLATAMFSFRRDATNYFKISLDEVFAKSLALYRRALELDPQNFLLATDLAMTYYGIPAPKTGNADADRKEFERLTEEALAAWQTCYKLAGTEQERQGVFIHLARLQINASRFDSARTHLARVTDPMFDNVKASLLKKLDAREHPAPATNAPSSKAENPKP